MGGRRIAIIGSGQAGLVCAHGLVRAGHEVTLYSDRSAASYLTDARPTGTAARFCPALTYERELGLAHWEADAPMIRGIHLTFSPRVGNRLLTMAAKVPLGGQAVDLRLQSHRWMTDLGDRIVVEKITVDRLDQIAAEHEFVLVASGRGPLAELFPRNAERSVYAEPQRKLAMVIVTGCPQSIGGIPFLPAKFNLFGDVGEAFWIPYHHKDHGPTWCLLFEARAGGAMDRFDGCKTGEEAVARAKQVISELIPWDAAWVKDAELADPNGWLIGAVTPTVREPLGRLPSGRMVMPLGDTAISMDPIAGQGANLGNKLAHHLTDAITAADGALDAAWMTATFEAFWADHGAATVRFNNLFLEPMSSAGQMLLVSQYGTNGLGESARQRLADELMENFADPRLHTDAFFDKRVARATIAKLSGQSPRKLFAGGMMKIGAKQLGRLFGKQPVHPVAPT
ncbi:MAG: styrene monooxygenase/indole monooxygenase family protein [Kofleriaceae bacterium]